MGFKLESKDSLDISFWMCNWILDQDEQVFDNHVYIGYFLVILMEICENCCHMYMCQ